jgi:hypothetical protein
VACGGVKKIVGTVFAGKKVITYIWLVFFFVICKKKNICDGFSERYLSVSNSVSIATDLATEIFLNLKLK